MTFVISVHTILFILSYFKPFCMAMCSMCLCHQKYSENVLLRWARQYHFYNKTNQMHNISKLFYFGTILYMFRTAFPSIIRSLRLHTASGISQTGSVSAY
jgi:hypothetical protein